MQKPKALVHTITTHIMDDRKKKQLEIFLQQANNNNADVQSDRTRAGSNSNSSRSNKRSGSSYAGKQKRFSVVEQLINNPAAEMVKFGLPANHPVVDTFACAFYPPNKKLMVQGTLWLTSRFIAFRGWPIELRILLPLKDTVRLDKAKTLHMFDNAINLTVTGHGDFFFASFLDRDQCYFTLKSAVAMENHMHELQVISVGDEGGLEGSTQDDGAGESGLQYLELGVQAPKAKRNLISVSPPVSPSAAAGLAPLMGAPVGGHHHHNDDDDDDDVEKNEKEQEEAPYDIITTTGRPRSATHSTPLVKALLMDTDTTLLVDALVPYTATTVFRECWLGSHHFHDFLTLSGERAVKGGEWAPLGGARLHLSDKSRIPFAYTRSLTFQHMRSFLALPVPVPGLPPFANVICTQYLYLFGVKSRRSGSSSSTSSWNINDALGGCRPHRGVVLSITECAPSLRPLQDSFRVLTYWAFDQAGADKKSCHVRCCVQVPVIHSAPFLTPHLIDGLVDRAAMRARELHAFQADRMAEYSREQDSSAAPDAAAAAGAAGAGAASSAAAGSVWSATEVRRASRFKRSLVIRSLQELKLAQAGPQGFRAGRNSAARLHRQVVLLVGLMALLVLSFCQSGSNALLATRLEALSGELRELELVAQGRAPELEGQLEKLAALVELSVQPPTPAQPPQPPTYDTLSTYFDPASLSAWLPTSFIGTAAKTEL